MEAWARLEPAEQVVRPSTKVALARAPVANKGIDAASVTAILWGLRMCRVGG